MYHIYIYCWRKKLNPLKSELFTKQACRDAVVVYSLFFSPTTYTSLYSYVLSTVLQISNFIPYIYIWRNGLPWHKVLNAVVGEQSIHKLKNQRRCIDSL